MAGKREKPEEIVSKLRQVEVLQGQGATIAEAVRAGFRGFFFQQVIVVQAAVIIVMVAWKDVNSLWPNVIGQCREDFRLTVGRTVS